MHETKSSYEIKWVSWYENLVGWDNMGWDEWDEGTVNEEAAMETVFLYDKTFVCIRQEFVWNKVFDSVSWWDEWDKWDEIKWGEWVGWDGMSEMSMRKERWGSYEKPLFFMSQRFCMRWVGMSKTLICMENSMRWEWIGCGVMELGWN